MSRTFALAALLSAVVAMPASAQAMKAAPKVDKAAEMKKMKAEAKITEAAATATAMAKVPHSTVNAMELERENGHLLYSFDMKVAGKTGIDEVQVDALTGQIIGKVQHESPAAEKKEAAKEKAEMKKPAPKKIGH